MNKKKALITGITGQYGAYLTRLLFDKGYEVHGVIRRTSTSQFQRLYTLMSPSEISTIKFHYGDVTDALSIISLLQKVQPDELYNLAAQSYVAQSFEAPEYTARTDALGALH
ncbi:MAG: GDP-mannose 4,6-dehydratase, partial [Candidatus Babeliales bacterium]